MSRKLAWSAPHTTLSIGASRGLINILSTKGLRVRISRFAYENQISCTLKCRKWYTNERVLMKDRLILHLYHTLSTSTKPVPNCSMKVIFTEYITLKWHIWGKVDFWVQLKYRLASAKTLKRPAFSSWTKKVHLRVMMNLMTVSKDFINFLR